MKSIPYFGFAEMLKSYVFMVIRLSKFLVLTIFLSALIIGQGVKGQVPKPDPNQYNYKQWKKAISIWQIEHLKSGILLVRLATRRKSVVALRKAGNDQKANQIERETRIMNSAIIQGFRTGFDFCDVYFFESDYSDMVRAHDLNNVKFVDQIIQNDSLVDFAEVDFLVAEYATLSADTINSKRVNGAQKGRGTQSSSYVNSNMGISGLVVKSDQFVQLVDPFPYYVRTYASLSVVERSPVKAISVLNKKLRGFYDERHLLSPKKKRKFRKAESHVEMQNIGGE